MKQTNLVSKRRAWEDFDTLHAATLACRSLEEGRPWLLLGVSVAPALMVSVNWLAWNVSPCHNECSSIFLVIVMAFFLKTVSAWSLRKLCMMITSIKLDTLFDLDLMSNDLFLSCYGCKHGNQVVTCIERTLYFLVKFLFRTFVELLHFIPILLTMTHFQTQRRFWEKNNESYVFQLWLSVDWMFCSSC